MSYISCIGRSPVSPPPAAAYALNSEGDDMRNDLIQAQTGPRLHEVEERIVGALK